MSINMDDKTQELLAPVRDDIDRIDKELLRLFTERMKCSDRVAKIKEGANIPVFNAEREQAILNRVKKEAGEYGTAAVALYSSIMAVSRERQHAKLKKHVATLPQIEPSNRDNATVICQGVEGAYSHKAADLSFKNSEFVFRRDFESVFISLQKGEGNFGIVPVENSAAGSVSEVYGLIIKYKCFIVGATSVTVDHVLAVSKVGKVEKVISHPQALLQCADYIRENSFEKIEYSNTAAAAKYISELGEAGVAAICSREAAEKYELVIIDQNIQDDKNNHTRFAIISQKPVFPLNADKISLCFSVPNITGSLYRVLERFALRGLNLSKIESRPIKGSNFEYDFYLDFTGNIRSESVIELIYSLEDELPRFAFLGNYKEGE